MNEVVLVLDTNIVLDLFVFQDARCLALQAQLDASDTRWLASVAMRDELAHVLDYPAILAWRKRRACSAETVLARFDRYTQQVAAAPPTAHRCSDPDDQKFIDLAVQQRAVLLSKDKAVLRLKSRLARVGVCVNATWKGTP